MAIIINVKIVGLDKLKANFQKAPTLVYSALTRAINTSALIATQKIKEVTPKKTGNLAGSIRPTFGRLKATISPHKNYAIYVHEGTDPHTILPVRKKALFWKGALHPVRRVEHPGTKPNPFMENGLNNAKPDIERVFNMEINGVLQEIANI